MNKQYLQFANYEVSTKLKELGFNEPSPAFYTEDADKGLAYQMSSGVHGSTNLFVGNHYTVAPLIQQARMFMMIRYGINISLFLIPPTSEEGFPYFEIKYSGKGAVTNILYYDCKTKDIEEEYYEAVNKTLEVILEDIEQGKIKNHERSN